MRTPEQKKLLTDAFDVDCEHPHAGFEALVVNEMTVDRLWSFLDDLRESGDNGTFPIPDVRPADLEVKKLVKSALKGKKSAGWAGRLFEGCSVAELPVSVTDFLTKVYIAFPKPADIAAEIDLIPVPGAGVVGGTPPPETAPV